MRRFAISLPDGQARLIERLRHARGISRSRLIQRAIDLYLAEAGRVETVRRYEEGYRRRPERVESRAFALAAAATLGVEDWE
jgi:metal-responsive CopG/Arc/MetJ family transcriptional regulator